MRTQFINDVKQAINKLMKQGSPAVDFNLDCLYRTGEGNKCLVGHMIKDEHYHRDLEEHDVTAGEVLRAVENSLGYPIKAEELDLILDLQKAHDNLAHFHGMEISWEEALEKSIEKKVSNYRELGLL